MARLKANNPTVHPRRLPLRSEACSDEQLRAIFRGTAIVLVSVPAGHSLEVAFPLRIGLSSGAVLQFSTDPVDLGDWQEIGQLCVTTAPDQTWAAVEWESMELREFKISQVDLLIHEAPGVSCCSGIVFTSDRGDEGFIAGGIPPGSVTASFPGFEGDLRSEFHVQGLRRQHL